MPVYSVEGKLGTGKTKFTVWMAQQAMLSGRRVASNLDLKLELLTPYRRSAYMRIPDKPTVQDLEAMGHGNPDSYEEDRNGVLILDECGTWLNSRAFQDKGRMAVIDWLIHARKHGWDVYIIVQDQGMIDKQIREALIEYQCRCIRMDKVRIPLIGYFLSAIWNRLGYFPRFHLVTARVGYGAGAIVAERWMFRGNDLHDAYDTRQVFRNNYEHGTYSVLPPPGWQPKVLPFQALKNLLKSKVKAAPSGTRSVPEARPKLPIVELIQQRVTDPSRRIMLYRRLQARGLL